MQTSNTNLSPASVIPDLSQSPAQAAGGGKSTAARLKEACQQFEGEFMSLVLQEMRKTIPKDTLLGDDGHTQEIFTGMMDDEVAQQMAKQGGPNDLAMQMYRQLAGPAGVAASPAQSAASGAAPAAISAAAGVETGNPARPAKKPASQEHIDTSR